MLEYNARFGDPEAQVVLPRMKNDIIDVAAATMQFRHFAGILSAFDFEAVFRILALSAKSPGNIVISL